MAILRKERNIVSRSYLHGWSCPPFGLDLSSTHGWKFGLQLCQVQKLFFSRSLVPLDAVLVLEFILLGRRNGQIRSCISEYGILAFAT
jgi:hypothetical protein